jgi:rhamnulokinase/L-fuculokinase
MGLSEALTRGPVDSIGIDTWGVDFGLIGEDGRLLSNLVHYRDSRTDDYEVIYRRISREKLYAHTGIQEMQLNSIHQLYALARKEPDLLKRTKKVLFTPDLLNYFLTGKMCTEYTIASTSELLNATTRDWDRAVLADAGLLAQSFCEIVMPGTICGTLSEEVQRELDAPPLKVVCVASHDTASAVIAVPTPEDEFLFLSSGTWSLLGTVRPAVCNGEKALRYKFTNEGGAEGKILFMKNIMGSWLIQESRRHWKRAGRKYGYGDLDVLAEQAPALQSHIDVDHPDFLNPEDMPATVRAVCQRTGQPVPDSDGAVIRCIYESLALKYRRNIEELLDCTGGDCQRIHMIGGGVQSKFMCGLIAEATGRTVVAGPVEATALGNIAMQLIAGGVVQDVREARRIIAESERVSIFEPESGDANWEEAYGAWCRLFGGEGM